MRQTRLLILLLMLVLAAGAGVWFVLQRDRPAAVNVEGDNATLNLLGDGSPLQGENAGVFGNQPLDGQARTGGSRSTPPNPDHSGTTEPAGSTGTSGDSQWVIHGRIELAEDVPPRVRHWLEDAEGILVDFLPGAHERDDVLQFELNLDEDLQFSGEYDDYDLDLEDGAQPAGIWRVLCALDYWGTPTLGELDDPAKSPGLVTPKINGRDIDLGVIRVGLQDVIGDELLFTGRLVHTSGRPVSLSGEYCLYGHFEIEGEEWDEEVYLHTSEDGSFVSLEARAEFMTAESLVKAEWYMSRSDEDYWNETPNRIKLAPPTCDGTRVDFGEMKVGGALIEVVLKGKFDVDSDAQGNLKVSEWGEYDEDYVVIELESSNQYFEIQAYPEPHTTRAWVPEGRYVWNLYNETKRHFADQRGVVLAREGEVTQLVIEPEFWRTIPVEITGEGLGDSGISLSWWITKDAEDIAEGSFWGRENAGVPFIPGSVTSFTVSAEGYKDARQDVSEDCDKLVVVLEKSDTPPCKLIVVIPPLPRTLVDQDTRMTLWYSVDRQQTGAYVRASNLRNQEWSTYRTGKCTITLMDGREYGYPNGIFSGPVEVVLKPGETITVVMPEVPEPPLRVRVGWTTVNTRVGGNSADIDAPLIMRGYSKVASTELHDNGSLGTISGVPTGITDGTNEYPVNFELPKEEGGVAVLSVEFEHTIEVRVLRDSGPLDRFSATVSHTFTENGPFPMRCYSQAVDGVAKLWIPPGKPYLSVSMNGQSIFSQPIEVKAGQVTRVDVKTSLAKLSFEVPAQEETSPDDSDLTALWRLERREADGSWVLDEEFSENITYLVGSSMYRAVPWNGSPRDAIEIDMGAGVDRTIRLPKLPTPKFGNIVLKFDVGILGSGFADFELRYVPVNRLLNEDGTPADFDPVWVEASVVPDGVRLKSVLLGTEIAIWGGMYTYDDETEEWRMLKPLKCKPTKENEQIEAVFSKSVELDDEWYDVDIRIITDVPGLMLGLDEDGYLAPGLQKIAAYGTDGKQVFTDTITCPETSEEPFKIPANLRAALENHNLIDPDSE